MWRAVDNEGEVLEILVQPRRDKAAALRLIRKLLRRHTFAPAAIVTDKLRSYGAALREIGFSGLHEQAFAPTIERRTRIGRFDDANERCKASNPPNRLSALFPSTRPFTIRSMCNATWSAVRRSDSFERRPRVFG
jgi:transposase-like protein